MKNTSLVVVSILGFGAYRYTMKVRLHALKVEIKEIESIIDALKGPMLEHANEELKNLRFEMDMLNRSIQRTGLSQTPLQQHLEEEMSA